jgi:hypothetical protein
MDSKRDKNDVSATFGVVDDGAAFSAFCLPIVTFDKEGTNDVSESESVDDDDEEEEEAEDEYCDSRDDGEGDSDSDESDIMIRFRFLLVGVAELSDPQDDCCNGVGCKDGDSNI